ncbi:hypothetical protein ABIB81_008279 [Bradyrhizobium sp. I1.7.5]
MLRASNTGDGAILECQNRQKKSPSGGIPTDFLEIWYEA